MNLTVSEETGFHCICRLIYIFEISYYDFADNSYKDGFHFEPMNLSNNTEAIPQARAMQIMEAEKLRNWMFIYFVLLLSRLSGIEKDFVKRNVDI